MNPGGPVRFFLNGGVGGYHFDPGQFEAGWNLGLGFNVPAERAGRPSGERLLPAV